MVLEDSTTWSIVFLSAMAFIAYKMYYHARGHHTQGNPAHRTREENLEALVEIFPTHSVQILHNALDRASGSVSLATQYLLENEHSTESKTIVSQPTESGSYSPKSTLSVDIVNGKWSPNAEDRQKMLLVRKQAAVNEARRKYLNKHH